MTTVSLLEAYEQFVDAGSAALGIELDEQDSLHDPLMDCLENALRRKTHSPKGIREVYPESLRNPSKVVEILKPLMMERRHQEQMWLLCLDTRRKVIAVELLSLGLLNEAPVDARIVFRKAIQSNAGSIILAHNHPTGDPHPSTADIDTTAKLQEAGKLLGVSLDDHLILGIDAYEDSTPLRWVSLREQGLM